MNIKPITIYLDEVCKRNTQKENVWQMHAPALLEIRPFQASKQELLHLTGKQLIKNSEIQRQKELRVIQDQIRVIKEYTNYLSRNIKGMGRGKIDPDLVPINQRTIDLLNYLRCEIRNPPVSSNSNSVCLPSTKIKKREIAEAIRILYNWQENLFHVTWKEESFSSLYLLHYIEDINLDEIPIGNFILFVPLDVEKRIRALPTTQYWSVDGYFHPHIDRKGDICLGVQTTDIEKFQANLWLDQVVALCEIILRTYNASSPFASLYNPDTYTCAMCEDDYPEEDMYFCDGCCSYCHDCRQTCANCRKVGCPNCFVHFWCTTCRSTLCRECAQTTPTNEQCQMCYEPAPIPTETIQ